MNITFACRHCEQAVRVEVPPEAAGFECPQCGHVYSVTGPIMGKPAPAGNLNHCLICGCQEMFVRSNFPQRLGVAIVVTGFVASSVTWFYHQPLATLGILFATALIDVVLYVTVGSLLQCYRCHAEYRGLGDLEAHSPFELETHERYRQQAARLAEREQQA